MVIKSTEMADELFIMLCEGFEVTTLNYDIL